VSHIERASAAAIRAQLESGRRVVVRARGHSMRPLLRDGCEVVLEPIDPRRVRVGDVVLAEIGGRSSAGGGLLLHRVVRRGTSPDDGLIQTRGDGRRTVDPAVPAHRVLARACAARVGSRLVSLDTPVARMTGWLVARFLPALWMFRRSEPPRATI
jgi:hypothetical protein